MHRPYGSEVVDHRGLVAGMWDARGMGAVLDRTMPHTPATRMVTVVGAVQALVCHGLGLVHPPRALVPLFFQPTPTSALSPPASMRSIALRTRGDAPGIGSMPL